MKQSHRLIHYEMKLSVLILKTMKSQKLISIDPFMVQFFEPNTSRSDAYLLNDVKFEVLPEDLFER